MTFLSYAPNCEDVVLWRALGDVNPGFYVDWDGDGSDPGAVTQALHDRNFRGISIVPTQEQADALRSARPADYVIAGPLDRRPNLALIVQEIGVDDVHFVRVNMPGNQASALSLMLPLSPWIVVVRAGDEPTDTMLAGLGFRPALYDGLNHFHVAAAHFDRLAPRLLAPANIGDGYLRMADRAVGKRLEAMEALVTAARLRETASHDRMLDAVRTVGLTRKSAADESKWLHGLLDEARLAEKNVRAEAAWLRGLWDEAKQHTETLRSQLDETQRDAAALRQRVAELNAHALSYAGQARRMKSAIGQLVSSVRHKLRRTRDHRLPNLPTPSPNPPEPLSMQAEVALPERARAAPVDTGAVLDMATMDDTPAVPPLTDATSNEARNRQRTPLTTVHQFHAGSSPGDAITNSMLLIRTILRDQGFRSDIYVQRRAAGLETQQILLLEDLPEHGGYVLLVHHSMGYPEFDQLMALPTPKILIYHNITPSHLLRATPRIEQMAQIGREQLAACRGQVVAALSDSNFNAMELYALRFPVVRTCPLLFDVAALAKRARSRQISAGEFTVLFVGRITPSKGQDALIEAYSQFRAVFDRPSRLILVGALDADEHAFLTRLETLVTKLGLQGHVHLTGLVSDEELHDWYLQANLYVSLSQHEGFCVPLVEAMAYGVPVLAWPSGAVAETLDDDAALLPSREPRVVAERMVRSTREKPADSRRQAVLSSFALERHVPTLMAALAGAGAFAPATPSAHAYLAANLHVAIAGHIGKSYSLAAVNRAIAAALERERPGLVRMIPVEAAPTRDFSEVPADERPLVQRLSARCRASGSPELILSQHYPVYLPADPADLKAAFFFWEESLVPAATVATLNAGFDAVFAPSSFVARALVDSGVARPVVTIGHAPHLPPYDVTEASGKAAPFTFLHVSSAFPRKGVDLLLAAWRGAFSRDDPVKLVLKTFPNPHHDTARHLLDLQASAEMAPVEVIDAELAAADMHLLLCQADAMVLPTRGEGYNLPAAEAMATGVPLITTGFGGHMDFCSSGTARLVAHRLEASRSHLATPHSLWAEPDLPDLTLALQEAFAAGRDGSMQRRRAARAAIVAAADPAGWTGRLTAAAAALLLSPPAPATRIAWISTWNVGCGIAEYSRALVEAMPASDITILADERTPAAPQVSVAWRLGDPENADRLLRAVARMDADMVVIQHQPGLMAWELLARLVSQLVRQGRGVIVTLHNVRHLVERAEPGRKDIVDALDRAARILVHTLADVQALAAIGLTSTAVLMPHAAPAAPVVALRALPRDAAPIIGCTGFFLPGKGIGSLIQAVASLRDRWSAIQLRLVNAEYSHPDSAAEIAACRALAEQEGFEVDWRTAFLPLDQIGSNLRGCDLLVLPYEYSKESSSAALRTALGTGIPVAVTPLPLFDEASSAVATLGGTDAASIALGIAALLDDEAERNRLQRAAKEWVDARPVCDIARRLSGMIEGLAAQRRIGQPLDGRLWLRRNGVEGLSG